MILSDLSIEQRMGLSPTSPYYLGIEPYNEAGLQGASYDVHITNVVTYQRVPKSLREPFLLPPHGACLAVLRERVVTPHDCVCRLEGVSSIGRMFVIVHCTAGWGDPGYVGNFTLEIVNHNDEFFYMEAGMRIGQLTWLQLDRCAKRLYKGRYQYDQEIQGAKAKL